MRRVSSARPTTFSDMARRRQSRVALQRAADPLRQRIAVEAAQLIAESGVRDYRHAKVKAAGRLGAGESSWPTNAEIETALREHQRLFQAGSQPQVLRRLREVALDAMHLLQQFRPRLVGAVLEGTADEHSALCLHLFSDDPDAVAHMLMEHGIHYQLQDRQMRLDAQRTVLAPVYICDDDNVMVDLTVLPGAALRQAPLDPVRPEVPMQRASRAEVRALLEADETHD